MGRMIDADALEELFREVISGIAKRPDMNGNMEHMIRASAMVIEMIKDAPTIEPETKWIPCSERLPEDSSPVLITHRGGVPYGWYNGRYFERGANTNHRKLQTVIAWMPLPEPYSPGCADKNGGTE